MAEFTMLLGGNLGDTTRTFAQAETLIAERIGLITARSRDHRYRTLGIHPRAVVFEPGHTSGKWSIACREVMRKLYWRWKATLGSAARDGDSVMQLAHVRHRHPSRG
jgi:hypothetical protein